METESSAGEQRARRLESLTAQLLEGIDGIPTAELHARPAPDDWTVMQSLAHVAELLPYWARQAQDVAARTEDDQPFGRTHDDPDRIAAVEAHRDDALDEVLPRIRAALTESSATLRALPAGGWTRTGRHARRGEMTVEQIVDQFLVEHLEEHTRQVEAARDALGRGPREDVR